MKNFYSCEICKSDNYDILYSGRKEHVKAFPANDFSCTSLTQGIFGQIVKCRTCGLVYRNPRESNKEIEQQYRNVVDEVYLEEIQGREKTFKKCLSDMERFKSKGKLLDIGCYIGIFLNLARENGWETYGNELSAWAVNYAKERYGLHVDNCTIDQLRFPTQYFDLITLWDVIEHFDNPLEELKHIWNLLKPDGVLCLSTMNVDCLFTKILGRHWPWWMKMHYYYFTPLTMTKILTLANFKVIACHNYTHYVSLRYLSYKLSGYSPILSELISNILKKLKLQSICMPFNLGDFKVFYAKKERGLHENNVY